MSQNTSSFLLGGEKVPAAKFKEIGDEHTLTITDKEMRQQTDYDTGEPLTFPNGDPRMQLQLTGTVEESEREGAEDDLRRRFYLKGESQKAAGEAVRAAGAKDLEIGGKLWMKYTADEKIAGSKKVKKLYKAAYKKPEGGTASAAFLGTGTGPASSPDSNDPPF